MTVYTIEAARSYLREHAEYGGWLADLDALLAQPVGDVVVAAFHDPWAEYHEAESFDPELMGRMTGALDVVEAVARPGCLSERRARRERNEAITRALDAENAILAHIYAAQDRVHEAHRHAGMDCSPSVCVEAAREDQGATLADWERELLLAWRED